MKFWGLWMRRCEGKTEKRKARGIGVAGSVCMYIDGERGRGGREEKKDC